MISPNCYGTSSTSTATPTDWVSGVTISSDTAGCYVINLHVYNTGDTTGAISQIEQYVIERQIQQYQQRKIATIHAEAKKLKAKLKAKKKYCKQGYDEIVQCKHSTKPQLNYKLVPKYTIKKYRGSKKKYADRNSTLTLDS